MSAAELTYTIADAAQAVGVHPHTIRKRIKLGKLQAALAEGPNGPEYRIPVDVVHRLAAEAMTERGHPQRQRAAAPSATPDGGGSTGGSPDSGWSQSPTLHEQGDAPSAAPSADSESSGPSTALAIARAQEMAAYTQRLLEPLQLRLAEQAEEIGRLRAELRHAHTEVSGQHQSAEEVGRLKAELEQAQGRVAEFEAAAGALEGEREAGVVGRAHRPWWRFW
jgi:hypothetical protein